LAIFLVNVEWAFTFAKKNKLQARTNRVCWNRGLAADNFIGNCWDNSGGLAVEQIQAASIQLATRYALRVRIGQPFGPAEFHDISGASG